MNEEVYDIIPSIIVSMYACFHSFHSYVSTTTYSLSTTTTTAITHSFSHSPTATITGVCSMWSPREQHAVAAYGSYMYVSGGYASRLYSQFSNCGPFACGDTDASAYRYFMSDVWRSTDGNIWESVTDR